MGTLYTKAHKATGIYTTYRVRIDYSGTTATATLLFTRTNTWSDTEYFVGATFTCGGVSKTFDFSTSGQVTDREMTSVAFNISLAGGTYDMAFSGHRTGWEAFTDKITIPAQYSTPSGVSAQIATNRTTELSAQLTNFSVSAWRDFGSGTRTFAVTNSSKSPITSWLTSTSIGFTIPSSYLNTNTASSTVYSFYAAAKNYNSQIGYGGPYYIASPTAPSLSFTAHPGTSPVWSATATVARRGGTTNSTSVDTAAMSRWYLSYKKTDDTYPQTPQKTSTADAKTVEFTGIDASSIETGYNYDVKVNAVNTYGGASSTVQTLYCPTGVRATKVDNTTPLQLVFDLAATYAGTAGNPNAGDMACYQIRYRQLGAETWLTTSKTPNTTIVIDSGLQHSTSYEYQVVGWNTLGLSNTSPVGVAQTAMKTFPEFTGPAQIVPYITSASNYGVRVSGTLLHTGGETQDSSIVATIALQSRRQSSSIWETLHTWDDSRGYRPGSTVSFDILHGFLSDEAIEIRLVATNRLGDSGISPSAIVPAAGPISLMASADEAGYNQINIIASSTDQNIAEWTFTCSPHVDDPEDTEIYEYTLKTDEQQVSLQTCDQLLPGMEYKIDARMTNAYGIETTTSQLVKLPPRALITVARLNEPDPTRRERNTTVSFRRPSSSAAAISEIYQVTEHALGNAQIGDDLYNKRITFPTGKIYHRRENIARITFQNGTYLGYRDDQSADVDECRWKFGLWSADGALLDEYYDGTSWRTPHIDFEDHTIIESITPDKGINASSFFSLTKCTEIPDWE